MSSPAYKVNFNANTEKEVFIRIYAVIHTPTTINGKREYKRIKFSVKDLTTNKSYRLKKELWNKTVNRCFTTKGTPEDRIQCRQANKVMNDISNAVDSIINESMLRNQPLHPDLFQETEIYKKIREMNGIASVTDVKDDFVEKITSRIEKPMSFSEYWQLYIKNAKQGIQRNPHNGNRYAPRTIIAYQKCLNTFIKFEKKKRHHYSFGEIDQKFYSDYLLFLEEDQEFLLNTIGEQIKNIKHLMRAAYKEKLHTSNEYEDFKVPEEEVDNIYLTEEEIERISKLDLSDPKLDFLDKYRDVFLIGCYTSLRVSDLFRLSKNNFCQIDGVPMIKLRTQKTGTEAIIPILWEDLEYRLEKYDYNLPKMSEAKWRKYIKVVARLAGINDPVLITSGNYKREQAYEKWELVSGHTARRSCITNLYKRGMPVQFLMQLSGHKKISTFEKYVKASNEEKALEIARQFEESSR